MIGWPASTLLSLRTRAPGPMVALGCTEKILYICVQTVMYAKYTSYKISYVHSYSYTANLHSKLNVTMIVYNIPLSFEAENLLVSY